jgi:hypothetical protein
MIQVKLFGRLVKYPGFKQMISRDHSCTILAINLHDQPNNPDKLEPYRFEKLSCHSFFGNPFYHGLSECRKEVSVFFFARNSIVNFLNINRISKE